MPGGLEFYKKWISPVLHSVSGVTGACRFQPTCSEYAAIAFTRHGILRGTLLAGWRLLRCNPFCRGGVDLVPDIDQNRLRPDLPGHGEGEIKSYPRPASGK